jgi:hypothetical protein
VHLGQSVIHDRGTTGPKGREMWKSFDNQFEPAKHAELDTSAIRKEKMIDGYERIACG